MITFVFKNLTSYGVRIYIEDKNLVASRPVFENQLLVTGDSIEISKQKNGDKKESKVYSIQFAKNIFVEEDVSKNCKTYPNIEYNSYKSCEDLFIQNFYKSFGHLNPIWAPEPSRNISGPTFIPHLTNDAKSSLFNIVSGLTPSECCQPCTTVRVSSKLMSSTKTFDAYNWIDLVPSPSMMITKTDFVSPSLATILADYGGSMGLWLGLGVVQLFQVAFNFIKDTFIKRCGNNHDI